MLWKSPPRYRGTKKPQFMITYVCSKCRLDSGRTELDGPWCYLCDSDQNLAEIKRVPMSPQALAERMKISTDRMIENLCKAYDISVCDWPDNAEEEIMLLEAMAQGQKLRDALQVIGKKRMPAATKTMSSRRRIGKTVVTRKRKK